MKYNVVVVNGGLHPPFDKVDFDDLEIARQAADATYHWALGTYGFAWPAQYEHLMEYTVSVFQFVYGAEDVADELCVYVFDIDDVEGNNPRYIRGVPPEATWK